ncbi:hypothetical protein AN217_04935 [Streptomyces qinglanensis]|uniref:Uncharacterized protein n=1 Tax=Streptomyces qinglanensis TaxID=943816 RepID=A0A1E7K0E9_9ACTN|nr:hypothetical protein AN217_04935 [Streptomyces qinglanensis]OEV25846.1 hypothetical protein AN220_11410 [Streptomyces nanshensis]
MSDDHELGAVSGTQFGAQTADVGLHRGQARVEGNRRDADAYALRWGRAIGGGDGAAGWRGKATVVTGALSLLLASALPLVALAGCFDGHAWAPVLVCDIDTGEGNRRGRVVELSRTGPGVVGWDLAGREAVNGVNCAASGNQQVRTP